MILSILIPSIPSRLQSRLIPLYDKLCGQAAECVKHQEIEILCVIDNKRRSVGEKRNALLDIAKGEYIAFVDDDEDVTDDYIESLMGAIAANPNTDCIVFNESCRMEDKPPVIVRCGIEYENTDVGPKGATRKPWHWCCWKRSIANQGRFTDKNWGEDWDWIQQVYPLIRHQTRIDRVLRHYHHCKATSEAIR